MQQGVQQPGLGNGMRVTGSPDPSPWEGVGGWSTRRETGKEHTDVRGPRGGLGTVAESLWLQSGCGGGGCQNINVKKCLTVRSIKFEEYNSKKSYQVICCLGWS